MYNVLHGMNDEVVRIIITNKEPTIPKESKILNASIPLTFIIIYKVNIKIYKTNKLNII